MYLGYLLRTAVGPILKAKHYLHSVEVLLWIHARFKVLLYTLSLQFNNKGSSYNLCEETHRQDQTVTLHID